jgi:hypothetical protein
VLFRVLKKLKFLEYPYCKYKKKQPFRVAFLR